MSAKTSNIFTARNALIVLFVLFLFLRLFSNSSIALLGADNVKYMETSKRFPAHTLYNNQLYLLHPPLYPYIVHFFTLIFQEDYIAAITLSLLASIITFFIIYKLFMTLTDNFSITFFVLLFYTLSVSFIEIAKGALKESFVVMLVLLAIYFFVDGIKSSRKRSIILASIFTGLLSLSSDHIVFLAPALILSYLFFNPQKINIKPFNFPNLKFLVLPMLIIFLIYGSWSAVKFYQYSTHEYYPNGVEGTPISTKDLSLMQVIDPHNFEDYNLPYISTGAIATLKKLAFQLGYMFNMEPFSIPPGLNFSNYTLFLSPWHLLFMAIIYIPLFLLFVFGFMYSLIVFSKTKKLHENAQIYIMLLFFLFLIPIKQTIVSPRYLLTAYIFFFYFIGYGAYLLFKKELSRKAYIAFFLALFLLVLIIPIWYANNGQFIFFTKKSVAAQNTADFINKNIDKDAGIMAQAGYTAKIIYLTGYRTVGLYHKPEKLMEVIDYYNVSYVVFGRFYTWDQYQYSIDSVNFIMQNPDKFELVAKIQEDYSQFYVEGDKKRTDEVYVYKVNR